MLSWSTPISNSGSSYSVEIYTSFSEVQLGRGMFALVINVCLSMSFFEALRLC